MATDVTITESPEAGETRFKIELEFVQLLADMTYVQFLGSQGFLNKPAFMRYLEYLLKTWSAPAYFEYVRFPLGLTHLRLLTQDSSFREAAASAEFAGAVRKAEYESWLARADLAPVLRSLER